MWLPPGHWTVSLLGRVGPGPDQIRAVLRQKSASGSTDGACLKACFLGLGWAYPQPLSCPQTTLHRAGARAQGCLKIPSQTEVSRPASRGTDGHVSCLVAGWAGLLLDCG